MCLSSKPFFPLISFDSPQTREVTNLICYLAHATSPTSAWGHCSGSECSRGVPPKPPAAQEPFTVFSVPLAIFFFSTYTAACCGLTLEYLPWHLEQKLLVESAKQISEPPYLAKTYTHSAIWPSGERWERREATKEKDSETDKVELERHTPKREETQDKRKTVLKERGKVKESYIEAKKDDGRKLKKIFQRELSMVSKGVKGKEVKVEQCCPVSLKGLKSYFVPVCHHPWCIS